MAKNSWNDFLRSTKGKYTNIQQASLAYRFRGIQGATYEEVIKRIPKSVSKRYLTPIAGKVDQGVEYKWSDSRLITIRVRIHGVDPSAPVGSNAYNNWVVRIQYGNKHLDHLGNFHPRNAHKPDSPHYNPRAANDTHIPIQTPTTPI